MKTAPILFSAIWLIFIGLTSCSEESIHPEDNFYTTIFSVYECNEDYSEKSASAAFVSIDAEISIWTANRTEGKTSYKLVDILKTGEDGKAVYKHNMPMLYYSVQKYNEDYKLMSNIISPLEAERTLANKFQVEGIFSSEEDLQNSKKYNLPHLAKGYRPKIGNVKLRDLNNDDVIDLKDSVDKIPVYNWTQKPNEETVYIAIDLLSANKVK